MSSPEFDEIIDDCFLYGAAISRTRKYENRINLRAVKLIEEMPNDQKTGFKAD